MFCDRNQTMMMENARTVRRSVDANEQARERAKTTPLRNEAQLNCVALRSQLDCEVTYGAVKGQDERPLRGALDSPVSHHRTSMLTSENKLRRAATSAFQQIGYPPGNLGETFTSPWGSCPSPCPGRRGVCATSLVGHFKISVDLPRANYARRYNYVAKFCAFLIFFVPTDLKSPATR